MTRFFCFSFIIFALPTLVSAQQQVFTDANQFAEAVANIQTEDFEEARVGPGEEVEIGWKISMGSNNDVFLPGEIIFGLSFSQFGTLTAVGEGFDGLSSKAISSLFDYSTSISVFLPENTKAFAANFKSLTDDDFELCFNVTLADDSRHELKLQLDSTEKFMGFSFDIPITYVSLSVEQSTQKFAIDNVRLGNADNNLVLYQYDDLQQFLKSFPVPTIEDFEETLIPNDTIEYVSGLDSTTFNSVVLPGHISGGIALDSWLGLVLPLVGEGYFGSPGKAVADWLGQGIALTFQSENVDAMGFSIAPLNDDPGKELNVLLLNGNALVAERVIVLGNDPSFIGFATESPVDRVVFRNIPGDVEQNFAIDAIYFLENFRIPVASKIIPLGGIADDFTSDFRSVPFGISKDGRTIVGQSGLFPKQTGFRWRQDVGIQPIELPAEFNFIRPADVSGNGCKIAGQLTTPEGGLFAIRLDTETLQYEDLGSLDGNQIIPMDIAEDGMTIIGRGNRGLNQSFAIRWTEENGVEEIGPADSTSVSAISMNCDGTLVVGSSMGDGFIWSESEDIQILDDFLPVVISGNGRFIIGRNSETDRLERRDLFDSSVVDMGDSRGSVFFTDSDFSDDGKVFITQVTIFESPETVEISEGPNYWTQELGFVSLPELFALQNTNVLEWENFGSLSLVAVSGDGRTITGAATTSYGATEGFVVDVTGPPLFGDVNGDGELDLLDIGPFIEALSDACYLPSADMNHDGRLNLLDIAPFVDALNSGEF